MSVAEALAAIGEVLERRPFPYASSWRLDAVRVRRPSGAELRLLVKQLAPRHPIKPPHACDPSREPAAYRLLAEAGLGTPHCWASGRGWLVLEQIEAAPLWQSGALADWAAAAGWAARLHAGFAARTPRDPVLGRHDGERHRDWLARAVDRCPAAAELAPGLEAATARLQALPATLIHGELYPPNVLVSPGRVTAVDWEMAAIGPGVIDLAALVTGWDRDARAAIVRAYGDVDARDLAAAELVLAVQWLGWPEPGQAPEAQRYDWLAESRRAASEL